MPVLIKPSSCSVFPVKQLFEGYVVRSAGTCCKCAESGSGSRGGCCDDSGEIAVSPVASQIECLFSLVSFIARYGRYSSMRI